MMKHLPFPTPATPGANVLSHRVYYGETDRMSYVYYGNYPSWFEQGRTEWLRQHGLCYKNLEERGLMLPVRSLSIRYLRPARYDELLKIVTALAEKSRARMTFLSAVYGEDDICTAEGTVELAAVDPSGKPRPIPEDVAEILAKTMQG